MSIKKEILLNTLQELVYKETGANLTDVRVLRADASERKIYRLFADGKTLIGIYNEDRKENLAFINFTKTFIELGFSVPEIFGVSDDELFYLEQDLGDTTLFSLITAAQNGNYLNYYKQALADLIRFQTETAGKLNFDYCYQTKDFNSEMVRTDLMRFNEFYINLNLNTAYDRGFSDIILDYTIRILADVRTDFFLYRDFQPRNIMIKDNIFFYIDYQSGRNGPLQYDVASFLYSGSINITDHERTILLDYYLNELGKYTDVNKAEFMKHFYFFVLIRLLQMLGSYSYLSRKRNDRNILRKIPKALENIRSIAGKLENADIKKFVSELLSLSKLYNQ